ncbi:MAG: 6-hydroxymethyl-7,8-dihydropterin pyrophosphokinase [Desulfurococcales archaeon ex4484_58]|nr:MAG: 6-hydroxymethyl-7,8-dihydropterin pyrophosphokinase [Desulfurococcales archaeon ex4484_58]
MKWYDWIVEKLGIDPASDRRATHILSELMKNKTPDLNELENLIEDRVVIVFGAGPSLSDHLSILKPYIRILHKELVLISADGATKALLEENILPDIIVTDLDGDLGAIVEAGRRGSYILVHGHGDNIELIKKYVSMFLNQGFKVIGTTQVEPLNNVFNFGGFTDGDRCVFLAHYFNASRIILAGMDLGYVIGEYSGRYFSEKPLLFKRKIVKLEITGKLLDWITCRHYIPTYTLSKSISNCILEVNENQLPIILRSSTKQFNLNT